MGYNYTSSKNQLLYSNSFVESKVDTAIA